LSKQSPKSEEHQYSLYGSSRIGVRTDTQYVSTAPALTYGNYFRKRGQRQYELTNHLGNVLTTINDKKYYSTNNYPYTLFRPVATGVTDYYPFGMPMPGHNWPSSYVIV
jgi:hypothetical protein